MAERGNFGGLRVAAFESRMAAEMARLIERSGGRPSVAPSMREIPLEDHREVLQFGEQCVAGRIDVLILLTGVGTRTMIDVLRTRYSPDAIKAALGRRTLVARGPKPAAVLREFGLEPHITVPEPNTWRDLIHVLDADKPVAGLRVAVQEYGVSNAELLAALRARGAEVMQVPVYRWALPDDIGPLKQVLDAVLAGRVDVMLITNAVQVDHAIRVLHESGMADGLQRLQQAARRMVVASIGPTASERLQHYGLPVDFEPSHPKMGILVRETGEQAATILERKRAGLSSPSSL
jgi:uroporphyrinogen-III synthase